MRAYEGTLSSEGKKDVINDDIEGRFLVDCDVMRRKC